MSNKLLVAIAELFEVYFIIETTRVNFYHDISLQLLFVLDIHMLNDECKGL